MNPRYIVAQFIPTGGETYKLQTDLEYVKNVCLLLNYNRDPGSPPWRIFKLTLEEIL